LFARNSDYLDILNSSKATPTVAFLCEKITTPLNNLSQFSSFAWYMVASVAGRLQGWASETVVLSVRDGCVMPDGKAPGYLCCVG